MQNILIIFNIKSHKKEPQKRATFSPRIQTVYSTVFKFQKARKDRSGCGNKK
jgi:hypothetical protein